LDGPAWLERLKPKTLCAGEHVGELLVALAALF
jgi:hypothetical protein